MEHWAKIVYKKIPQNMFKTRFDNLGSILGIFGIMKIFRFFEIISKTRPSMEHWAKFFFEKYPQNMFKTQLDTFGNDFTHFWNFEKNFIY